MRILIVFVLTIAIIAASFFAYQKYQNPNTTTVEKTNEIKIYSSSTTDFQAEISQIRSVEKKPTDISNLKYYGWIPDWAMVAGLDTLKDNPQIKSVSPFWFDLADDGSLNTNRYTNWNDLIIYTSANGVDLVPTITAFDKDILTKVLNSQENTNRFIDSAVEYAIDNDYTGLDLDFESFYFNDQKLFTDAVKELKSRLSAVNKVLYISILPKWGNHIDYAQSKATLDYKQMGDIFDKLIIQGYSYSAQDSGTIGPVGPIDWEEDMIRYAIKEGVSRDKIVLGIATYAQDWSERPIQKDLTYFTEAGITNSSPNSDTPVAYYHDGVDKLFNNYSVDQSMIESWGEMLGSYVYGGQTRYVVYSNNESIQRRKKLAADYGINGISYWKLGSEGTLQL